MQADLVIENVLLPGGTKGAVTVAAGLITSIGAENPPTVAARFDARDALIVPGLVDGHVHLDKTLLGLPFIPHIPGDTVSKRIEAEKHLRRTIDVPVETRGCLLIEKLSAQGTVALRSHVDVDTEIGLKGLEAELTLKERYRHLMDIQIVAFPQSGILRDPGTADLMDAALEAGADLVGGLDPAGIDGDVSGHLDVVFDVADKHGVGVDLHLHDGGALGAFELRQIAERTLALGLTGKVAVSHAFCLGELDDFDFGRTAALLAKADIAIMTTAPGPVSMPPVKPLKAEGVRVFCGSDNIRDAWSPFGNGDLLERAAIVCDRQDYRLNEDLELAFTLVTEAPSDVIGRNGGLTVGSPADFLLLPVQSIAEAVAERPARRTVFKRGVNVTPGNDRFTV
ncbi:amidohydrolase family protein [Roseibium aggregatum]|uniref:N-isopropylammelide isopropyl amidohydrolase n=1 Tax=Roseibium aggregatum TaxID=187304 RepID=A0A0M6YEH7_9HYPH|nr:amidohydrolase family protein [Roseibium aggregatum]CTQ47421.1 N-isopropylammelide isopropyl amidohydrolase [Roseibium aggregatum]